MVIPVAQALREMVTAVSPALLAQAERPLIERLQPTDRAKVLAALAALTILGIGMMFLTYLGARATRRYMNREPILHDKPPEHTPVREKDWTEKPLGEPFQEE